MGKFLIWWGINAVSLYVVASLLPGVHVAGGIGTLLIVALIIGLVNAIVRPVVYLLSCGLIILTIGLIIPIINALLLLLADSLAGTRFEIDTFLWAVIAALLMGLINSVLHGIIEPKEKRKQDEH